MVGINAVAQGRLLGMAFLERQSPIANHQVGIIGHFMICTTRSLHKRALQVGYKLLCVLTKTHHFTKRIDLAIKLSPADQVCSIVIVLGTGIGE